MESRYTNARVYFDELAYSFSKYMLPYLQAHHPITAHSRILEIGCGAGGNLKPFVDLGCEVMGFDLDAARIVQANDFLPISARVNVFCQDVFEVKEIGKFDVVIVRDVIEHIPDKTHFFHHIQDFVKDTGILFFAFPPWYMPFGGHQQIGKSKLVAHLPFFHILPRPIYKAILIACKENKDTIDELLSIKECSITIEQFNRFAKENGYNIVDKRLYFINPHYEIKFKLKPRIVNTLLAKIPFFRNFYTTGCFFLLNKKEQIAIEK